MARVLGVFLLLLGAIQAKDFGVHGTAYPVSEESLLEHIKGQLANLPEATLRMKQLEVQERVKQSVLNPTAVQDLHKTTIVRRATFDPSITLEKDIQDHLGNLIASKGARYNPLTTMQLKASLLIFDGTDLEQVNWAKGQGDQTKWILTKGRPFDLMKQHHRAVFFDQDGTICRQFKIMAVPAIVRQKGYLLEIEEGLGGEDAH